MTVTPTIFWCPQCLRSQHHIARSVYLPKGRIIKGWKHQRQQQQLHTEDADTGSGKSEGCNRQPRVHINKHKVGECKQVGDEREWLMENFKPPLSPLYSFFASPVAASFYRLQGSMGEERETGWCKTLPAFAQPGMLSQQDVLMELGSSFFVVFSTEIQNPPQASEKLWRRTNQRILNSPLEHHLNVSNKKSQQLPIAKSY